MMLAGMEAPPNFGHIRGGVSSGLSGISPASTSVALVPFLLEGVAGVDALNQRGRHPPDGEGARVVADNLLAGRARARPDRDRTAR